LGRVVGLGPEQLGREIPCSIELGSCAIQGVPRGLAAALTRIGERQCRLVLGRGLRGRRVVRGLRLLRCVLPLVPQRGELVRRGHRRSPKRVRRLARAAGLRCVHPRPYKATTVQAKTGPRGLVDLVDRAFVADAPDEIWYGDITYIHTITGWVYLATVIDGF